MEHIAVWAATGLAAKMLADVLRRYYGYQVRGRIASARREIETDLAYVLAFAAALLVVRHVGLEAALLVVIVLRIAAILGARVVLEGNHTFLELYLAVVCLRLYDDPDALASVLQVAGVSVWVYAAYQKVYQREYLDGTYFYVTLPADETRLGKLASSIRQVPRIEGDYGATDPAALAFCRRLAVAVMVGETLPPLLAFAMNGTIWAVLLLVAVSVPVGLLSQETNFMITNLLLAAVFLVPFEPSAFLAGLGDPAVAAMVGLFLLWPPLHAALARHLRFSPWKLAGWGMYSVHKPRINTVLPGGELRGVMNTIPGRVAFEFGACRIGWVRDAIRRYFFRLGCKDPTAALLFRWYRLDGGRYATHCVVVRDAPGAPVQTFDIADEASAAAFARYLPSLSQQPEPVPLAPVAAALPA